MIARERTALATRPVARRAARLGPLARRRERWFYLLIAPWLLGFLLFKGGALLAVVGMAFAEWPLAAAPRYVGLSNLTAMLRDPLFGRSLLNTAYYAAGLVPAGLALGLGLALLPVAIAFFAAQGALQRGLVTTGGRA